MGEELYQALHIGKLGGALLSRGIIGYVGEVKSKAPGKPGTGRWLSDYVIKSSSSLHASVFKRGASQVHHVTQGGQQTLTCTPNYDSPHTKTSTLWATGFGEILPE